MLITTPSARYDMPWKAALEHAFSDFMVFFFPSLSPQVDWARRLRFCDKELAGVSFGAATDSMIADKLVEVCLLDGSVQWVLIHIEVQAQRDASLARRVLDYNYRIFKQYEQPVASLVLLADEDPKWRPDAFHSRVLGTVMGISFTNAKLLDYANRTEELQASDNPFAWVTLAHLRTQQARHDADQLYAAKSQLTRLLFEHGWSKERIIVLFKVINWMMVLPELLQRRYWQAVVELEKEREMELINPLEQMFLNDGIEKGLQKGLKQGLEQGLERGRREGAAAMLERQLVRRFGAVSKAAQRKLAKADLVQLEAWSDALSEVQSLNELFK